MIVDFHFDTETAPMRPGLKAPPLACVSYAYASPFPEPPPFPGYHVYVPEHGLQTGCVFRDEGIALLDYAFRRHDTRVVGHNVSYDLVVTAAAAPHLLPLMFAKADAGLIEDTYLNERLYDLSLGVLDLRPEGYYDLKHCAERYANLELDKEDWRMRYGELLAYPFEQWPLGSKEYSRLDALATALIDRRQRPRQVIDAIPQLQAAFALQLVSSWGVKTDAQAVFALRDRYQGVMSMLFEQLRAAGLLKEDGVQDTKMTQWLVEQSYPGTPPRTATGKVSTASDVVERCKHPVLKALKEYKGAEKILSTFVPPLIGGITHPICSNFRSLQKNGRISSSDPNLLNPPREGGIRECIVPRDGNVFASFDYNTLEHRTFGQVLKWMVGDSTIANKYQKDPDFDAHSDLAAGVMGIPYEQALALKKTDPVVKQRRQEAKPGNFGYQGGMGLDTFIAYAYKDSDGKVDFTREGAQQLKSAWHRKTPGAKPYFNYIGALTANGRATIQQFVSGRIRGGCSFTDAANGYWSALANDGAKAALYEIVKACYVGVNSPLYGARVVLYVYDEYLLECHPERGHEVGTELARVAIEVMQRYVPDIPIRGEPALTRRFMKGDFTKYENGRLVVWEPPPMKVIA